LKVILRLETVVVGPLPVASLTTSFAFRVCRAARSLRPVRFGEIRTLRARPAISATVAWLTATSL
jgi:hypothetical protein